MADYTDFIKVNKAPYAASKIGVYDSSGNRVGTIPLEEFKPNYGERLYRFGLLSDVHNETNQADENQSDIRNALSYLNNDQSVEFTVISGDLTQYSYSTNNIATEMALYQENKQQASPNTPVYPTTGNHDCPQSSDIDITTFFSYAGLSDIAPSDGATYSYEVTKTHTASNGTTYTDHFLFLGMKRYEFTSSTYASGDLTWLSNKLEAYKNDRCFIITHMFFPTRSGNFKSIYPSGNWLSGTQLTTLQNLCDTYKRTYWFNGHSHWKWYLQKYENKANIYPLSNVNRSCGWCIHCPSCASPIDSDGTSTRVSMAGQSEGAVVDVYADKIVVRGVTFKDASDSDYTTRYLPIAQYVLPTEPETSSNTGTTSTAKTTIVIKADTVAGCIGVAANASRTYKIKYSAIKIVNSSGTDITDATIGDGSASNRYKTGLYTSSGVYYYGAANTVCETYSNDTSHFPIIQTSSSSTGLPLYVQLSNIQYSEDEATWTDINENTTFETFSSKNLLRYVWVDEITDNPASLFS